MSYPAAAFSADAGLNGGIAATSRSVQVRFSVAGTIKAGLITRDQAVFFNRDTDTVIGTDHALATVTPSVSKFTAAQVAVFYAHNPAQLANLNITGASVPAAISSMKMSTVRFTPSGEQIQEEVQASSFQTSGDFQDTRVQIPTEEILDGYTFIRLLSDAQLVTAASYDATFTFAASTDRRLAVPVSGPKVIVSP